MAVLAPPKDCPAAELRDADDPVALDRGRSGDLHFLANVQALAFGGRFVDRDLVCVSGKRPLAIGKRLKLRRELAGDERRRVPSGEPFALRVSGAWPG